MANLKSSKKDLRRIAKRKARNQAVKTSLKTFIKKVKVAATPEDAATAMSVAQSKIDKAAQNGVLHKNAAARRKSRAAKLAKKA